MLREQVRALRLEMDEMRTLMARGVHAERDGGTEQAASDHGRRLSSTSTFVAVPAVQVHEFTDGHGCSNIGGYMQALPVKATGGISYDPSPNDVTGDISLVSVASDWSTTEIAASPAPLKLVHDSCAGPPSLALQLNTTVNALSVAGPLTLEGVDIGRRLFAPTCVRITTGDGQYTNANTDSGYMNWRVWDAASGHSYGNAFGGLTLHATGSVLLDACYDGFRALRVDNPMNDGWIGTIEVSTDGRENWRPMLCVYGNGQSCNPNGHWQSTWVGVDGNSDMVCTGLACCKNTKNDGACTFIVA